MVFDRGHTVNGEVLQVLEERKKTIDPDEKETYRFLGV